ncbi:hypothetical protein IVA88_24930 [Bradyrhizobium sp. 149]|uniref:hypothetical protein n=1 Tax=Bradyrhizobium sp. 149 TaxID=2782624 RepID=UPI001FFBB4F8|nr:hypothetical protein [Bradyrhizobium sp. 149]MCK1654665.1 hypothetical protein [Bradyrhizobium sp. 149]
MAKGPKKKKGASRAPRKPVVFETVAGGSIRRDEIYHRLEWYFDHSHNPGRGHSIDPNTPMTA